jgi:hypothetical protein
MNTKDLKELIKDLPDDMGIRFLQKGRSFEATEHFTIDEDGKEHTVFYSRDIHHAQEIDGVLFLS